MADLKGVFFYPLSQVGDEFFIDVSPYPNDVQFSNLPDILEFGDIIYSVEAGGVTYQYAYAGNYDGDAVVRENRLFDGVSFSERHYYLTDKDFNSDGYPTSGFKAEETSFSLVCFLSGVAIATPDGPRAVETLAIGDLVRTADGSTTPVKWLGRQAVAAMFVPESRAPVVIQAGALAPLLGEALPERDLRVTADHALVIDGVLVQAGALVNGTTIRRMTPDETGQRYTVFHIETEDHKIILAEGCPTETFVDNVSRRRFDNYAEYEALFGGEAETILEMDLPRAMSARQLPDSIRALIEVRRAA